MSSCEESTGKIDIIINYDFTGYLLFHLMKPYSFFSQTDLFYKQIDVILNIDIVLSYMGKMIIVQLIM